MKRLAFLAVAGILLAGCGGSSRLSKSAYEHHLQVDGSDIHKGITALTKSTSIQQLVTGVDAAEASVKTAADDLAALKPPSDAVDDNAAIVTGLRSTQSALEQVKANPTGARTIIARLQASKSYKDALNATADLKKKGYKVGVIGAPAS